MLILHAIHYLHAAEGRSGLLALRGADGITHCDRYGTIARDDSGWRTHTRRAPPRDSLCPTARGLADAAPACARRVGERRVSRATPHARLPGPRVSDGTSGQRD